MNGEQIQAAVTEYEELRKELEPIINGFGFKGLTVTVKLRNGEEWELVTLEAKGSSVRGVGRHPPAKEDAPTRWFSVHFDPLEITWIEFEKVPG